MREFLLKIITFLNLKIQLFGAPKIGKFNFSKQIITPSSTKTKNSLITIDKKVHWRFEERKTVFFPDTFVTVLNNGRVWGNEGMVINEENILFSEVSRHFGEVHIEKYTIFKLRKLIKPVLFKHEKVAVIGTSGAGTYYHWMMDIIPRFDLLIKSGHFHTIDCFVLGFTALGFQQELLKKLGIDKDKIIPSNDVFNFHIQARELIVPSFISPNDSPSYEACLFLRNLFKDDISNTKPERRIYIQRKNGRRVVNDLDLIEFLHKKGFEVIHPETMSVSDQAKLFSEAKFIVSPHGAGLTNLVFCNPGTKIIDIFSPEWINPCFWTLSSHLTLKYSYLLGEGKDLPENVPTFGIGTNIIVNMDKFKQLFYLVEES